MKCTDCNGSGFTPKTTRFCEACNGDGFIKPEPKVGMGVTIYIGSDWYPGTIRQVTHNGKRIIITHDKAVIRESGSNIGEAKYLYEPDPNGKEERATLRSTGQWFLVGGWHILVHLGERQKKLDPSF